ncbi:hypothetical protein ACC680_23455 [Rhizobium ruizarguesonis]
MEQIRPYFEILYFITGGPVLAVLAFLALKQVRLAEKSISISSKRDAFRIAAQQVHFYMTDVIPALNSLDEMIKEKKINFLAAARSVVENGKISVEFNLSDDEIKKFMEIAPDCTNALNRMESFCVPFCAELASENVAFKSVGSTFVHSVNKLLPIVAMSDGHYKNIKDLFYIWKSRIESEKLNKESNLIKEKLERFKDRKIIPIGLDS